MQIKNRRTYHGPGVYCGRPSVLGNPFRVGRDGDRDEVIAKHKVWLWNRMTKPGIIGDHKIMQALAALDEDSVLICWCAPERCHCENIIKAWKWAKKWRLI